MLCIVRVESTTVLVKSCVDHFPKPTKLERFSRASDVVCLAPQTGHRLASISPLRPVRSSMGHGYVRSPRDQKKCMSTSPPAFRFIPDSDEDCHGEDSPKLESSEKFHQKLEEELTGSGKMSPLVLGTPTKHVAAGVLPSRANSSPGRPLREHLTMCALKRQIALRVSTEGVPKRPLRTFRGRQEARGGVDSNWRAVSANSTG